MEAPAASAKRAVRAAVLAARAGRDPAAPERRLVEVLEALRPQRLAAYVSVGTEPATRAVLAPGVLLPVLLPDGDLDWVAHDGRLVPAGRGLLEPVGMPLGPGAVADCDVVVVPALSVDRRGTRLGRGGGSYDRVLRRATGLTVALLHDDELVDELPVEPHDVPVGAVVTPSFGLVDLRA